MNDDIVGARTQSAAAPPIPDRAEPDWETLSRLPIVASDESLVPVSLAPAPLKSFPLYARQGIPGAVDECYLRESVYRRLLAAARALPEGLGLVALDGWRPWRVQQYLFDTLQEAIRTSRPHAGAQELCERTREFVAVPSTDEKAPSPHLTGGAVDVTLCDVDGVPLEMGTAFDEAVPASYSAHFEDHDELDERQRRIRDRRRLLHHVMAGQGFTNLPSEWWHFDYGDQLWAFYSGQERALYGPAEVETVVRRWQRQTW